MSIYQTEKINYELEKILSDFDYLFQEGIYFKKEEIEKTKTLLKQFDHILNDKFLNIK